MHEQSIIGRREKDPVLCACCGREARGLGFADPRRPIMWICEQCPPIASEIYRMSNKTLSIYEGIACLEAAQAVASDQVEAILTALYNAGVSDLASMSREQFEGVVSTMSADGSLAGFARATVVEFGNSIRRQADAGKAPF